jgi:repressor LexA
VNEPKPLTAKQQKIFEFIAKHIETMGYPPTIRDICRAFDIKSPNGVMCHLNALKAKGKINRNEKLSRGITIEGVNAGGFSLPLLGVVAAGRAIEAVPQPDRLEFKNFFTGESLYALKVRGTSMIESHICDGDYVIIAKRDDAENGDKVIAMIERSMTLKKFYRRKDHIELAPANGALPSIKVDPSQTDIRVIGVLVGVVRKG